MTDSPREIDNGNNAPEPTHTTASRKAAALFDGLFKRSTSESRLRRLLPARPVLGCAAAAGATFCGLSDVDATLVAWGPGGAGGAFMVPVATNIVSWDVDGVSAADFYLFNFSTAYIRGIGGLANANVRVSGNVGAYPQLRGFTGGSYVVNGANPMKNSVGGFLNGAQWSPPPITKNFAFEFRNDTTNVTNYGWGTLQYNGAGQTYTITQAYYDDMGNAITVGQTAAVPEASPVALMCLLASGAAGVQQYRKRRSAGTR